jgi:hypothetical protein
LVITCVLLKTTLICNTLGADIVAVTIVLASGLDRRPDTKFVLDFLAISPRGEKANAQTIGAKSTAATHAADRRPLKTRIVHKLALQRVKLIK